MIFKREDNDIDKIEEILVDLHNRKISVKEAQHRLSLFPFQELEDACVDTHRGLRKGYPEVIFCPGKTTDQILNIARELYHVHGTFLATRAGLDVYNVLKKDIPDLCYHPGARLLYVMDPRKKHQGKVAVCAAGTADLPVAEEAAITCETAGSAVVRIVDVGIAGLHRLVKHLDTLWRAHVIIVVAGMEGTLPGVIAGMVGRPVIAVPTSVGYGANFQGLSPLLTMLNSCAPGIAVVNIDNGFGAGYLAHMINTQAVKEKQ